MFRIAIIAIMLSAVPLMAGAEEKSGKVDCWFQEGTFKRLDANNDGMISPEEAQADSDAQENFQNMDTNSDGQLEEGEFSRFEIPECG